MKFIPGLIYIQHRSILHSLGNICFLLFVLIDERKTGEAQTQRTQLSKVGFSAKLTCSFSFPDRDYLVAWFKDQIHLIDHDPTVSLSLRRGGRASEINLQDGTATLKIQNVSVEDAGKYCCKTVFTVIGKPEIHYWVLNVQGM